MKLWIRCLRMLETTEKILYLLRIVVGIGLVLTACGLFRERR